MKVMSWGKTASLEMFEMGRERTPLLERATFDGRRHIHFTETAERLLIVHN